MEYTSEFFGNGFSGRIKVGEPITKEMLEAGGVIAMQNFVKKKVFEEVKKPKKGKAPFKETEEISWLPGFLRLGQINFLYEIKQ
jgi:hypothetical protein